MHGLSLSFYDQKTWDAIENKTKTIETRALNPEEPERYFGDIEVGDQIEFVNKGNTEAKIKNMLVRVLKTYKWDNFEALRNEEKKTLKKIYSDKEVFERIKSLEEFKKGRDFTPGYVEKVEKNGMAGWEFEIEKLIRF